MIIGYQFQTRKNEPIEVAIAEAIAAYVKRFGVQPTMVRIHISNPVSVETPAGIILQRVKDVQPGNAWAGGEVEI